MKGKCSSASGFTIKRFHNQKVSRDANICRTTSLSYRSINTYACMLCHLTVHNSLADLIESCHRSQTHIACNLNPCTQETCHTLPNPSCRWDQMGRQVRVVLVVSGPKGPPNHTATQPVWPNSCRRQFWWCEQQIFQSPEPSTYLCSNPR